MKKILFTAIMTVSFTSLASFSRANDGGVDAGVDAGSPDAGTPSDAGVADAPTQPPAAQVEPKPAPTAPITTDFLGEHVIIIYPNVAGFEPFTGFNISDADAKALYDALAVKAVKEKNTEDFFSRKVKSTGAFSCRSYQVRNQKGTNYDCDFAFNHFTGEVLPSVTQATPSAPGTPRLTKSYQSKTKTLILNKHDSKAVAARQSVGKIVFGPKESEVVYRFIEMNFALTTNEPTDPITVFGRSGGLVCVKAASRFECSFSFDYRNGKPLN